jgi:hypothetical protein
MGRHTLNIPRLLVVTLALVIVPTAASAVLPNPCSLLTNNEAATLIGSKIQTRNAAGNRLYHSCTWTGENLGGYAPTHRSLMVQVTRATKAQFERSAKQTRGAIRVAGIGEAAFALPQGGGSGMNVRQQGNAREVVVGSVK